MLRKPIGTCVAHALLLGSTLLSLALVAGLACDIPDRPNLVLDVPDVTTGDTGDVPPIPQGRQLGEPCDPETDPCRAGLECTGGVCQPGGASPANTPCALTAECGDALHCSLLGVCAPAGGGAVGDPCTTAADCQKGLWCELVGFSGRCAAAGDASIDDACRGTGDCAAGLACVDGACAAGNLVFNTDLFFAGVPCAPDADNGKPFRVLFEVPRGGALSEFDRLPMPNDIRRKADGHVDLTGFPTPGPGAVGVDLVERLVTAAEADVTGWSTNPSILFRFSEAMDMGSIRNKADDDGPETLYMVDIDPDSPTYAERVAVGWAAGAREGSRRKYHCQNWLAARPAWERPLAGGRTYAVIVTTGVRSEADEPAEQAPDFAALLAATAPADAALLRAWNAYLPLRNWITAEDIDAGSIAAAAVFTTQDPRAATDGLRTAVRAVDPPTVSSATLCKDGVRSPCDDGLTGDEHVRGCFGEDPAFHEIHGRVRLPVFQEGTAPYLTPEEGGAIGRDAQGAPEVVRYEDVCFALTIPKSRQTPESGWPLAIYAHGTGGTFRSHAADGTAAALADLQTGEGQFGVAVLGIDQVAHGARRGESDRTPEELFFNAFNPAGSHGNVLQGVADQHALVRLAETLTVLAANSPTEEDIRFDPQKLVFVGHSQGGTVGVPFLAYEPALKAGVLSGAGGGLVLSLLSKTSPQDIKAGIAAAIQDEDLGEHHPVLNLLQLYFDSVDALNYAERLFFDVPEEQAGKHILQTYGQGDTFTPPACMRALGSAMRVTVARPVLDKVAGVHEADPPIEGRDDATWWTHNEPIMAVMVQAAPAGYDGHFVLFEDAGIQRQFKHFVSTFLKDGLPAVPPRN